MQINKEASSPVQSSVANSLQYSSLPRDVYSWRLGIGTRRLDRITSPPQTFTLFVFGINKTNGSQYRYSSVAHTQVVANTQAVANTDRKQLNTQEVLVTLWIQVLVMSVT